MNMQTSKEANTSIPSPEQSCETRLHVGLRTATVVKIWLAVLRDTQKSFLQPTIFSDIIYDMVLQQAECCSNFSEQNKYKETSNKMETSVDK